MLNIQEMAQIDAEINEKITKVRELISDIARDVDKLDEVVGTKHLSRVEELSILLGVKSVMDEQDSK